MTKCLGFAVTAKIVKHQKNYCITSTIDNRLDINAWVAWSCWGGWVMPLIGTFPHQLHIIFTQHSVGLKSQLIDISFHTLEEWNWLIFLHWAFLPKVLWNRLLTFIGSITPVWIAGDMTGEEVSTFCYQNELYKQKTIRLNLNDLNFLKESHAYV